MDNTHYYKLASARFMKSISRKEHLTRLYPKTKWEDILRIRQNDYDNDEIVKYLLQNIETLGAIGYRSTAEKHLRDYQLQSYPELFVTEETD